jgi:hypothetical protein
MRKRSVAIWGGAAFGVLAMLYVFSFGPVVWTAEKLNLSNNRGAGMALMMFYYPHFLVAAHQEWYFQYISWWADKEASHEAFIEFRKNFVPDLG